MATSRFMLFLPRQNLNLNLNLNLPNSTASRVGAMNVIQQTWIGFPSLQGAVGFPSHSRWFPSISSLNSFTHESIMLPDATWKLDCSWKALDVVSYSNFLLQQQTSNSLLKWRKYQSIRIPRCETAHRLTKCYTYIIYIVDSYMSRPLVIFFITPLLIY